MKKLIILFISALFLLACEAPRTIIDYDAYKYYSFVNNSGVNVVIEPKGDYSYFPTSLVLNNTKIYTWEVDFYQLPITKRNTDPVKVYFNETVSILFDGNFEENSHDPRNPEHYVYELLEDGHGVLTYTFTVEDYERAVEQNNAKR